METNCEDSQKIREKAKGNAKCEDSKKIHENSRKMKKNMRRKP